MRTIQPTRMHHNLPTSTPKESPTKSPTMLPTFKPISTPTCASFNFEAKFNSASLFLFLQAEISNKLQPVLNAPGCKGVAGKLKGFHESKSKAALELKVKFGDFKFNNVKIKEDDEIKLTENIMWNNPGISG